MELLGALQILDLIGGNGVDEVHVAGLIGGIDGGVVGAQHEHQLVQLHVLGIPVVGVLLIGHGHVVGPVGQHIGAGGDEASLVGPGAGVVLPILGGLNGSLLHGVEGREGHQVEHVGAGARHLDGQGGAVLGGGHGQVVGIADDAVEHIAVVGAGRRIGGALPAVLEVLGGQVGAVGPLQALTHGEGVGQAVLAHLIAGGEVGGQVALGVIGVQAAEGGDGQAGAVHGAVQGGVQVVRLGSQVQVQGVLALDGGILEILEAEQVGVDAIHGVALHVQVIVVIQRDDRVGLHQHILGLVHLGFAGLEVGLRLDLVDQLVILGPVGLGALVGHGDGDAGNQHHHSQQRCKQLLHGLSSS